MDKQNAIHFKSGKEVPAYFTGTFCYVDNNKKPWVYVCTLNGKKHSVGSPAVEYKHGGTEFWLYGRFYGAKEYWRHPLLFTHMLHFILSL